MARFEFVVSSGAPKRASSAARSHAVKNGLQRKSNAEEPKSSEDSQLIIRQKSSLKGRFRISVPAHKATTPSRKRDVEQHTSATLERGHDAAATDAKDTSKKSLVQDRASYDWDPIGSTSMVIAPSQSRGDPFNSLPIDQTIGVDKLLHFFVYRPNAEISMYEIQESWWAFAQSDAVVLHTTLAVAAVAWALMLPDPTTACGEGSRQKALAIRGIQEKLQNNDTSDATVGAIANLANMEGLEGRFDTALVHVQGLKLLMKARGGDFAFKDKLHIARAVNWADLQVSTALSSRPMLKPIYDLDSVSLPPQVLAQAEKPSLSHLKKFERTSDDTSIQFIFSILRQTYYAGKSAEVSATELRTLTSAVDYRLCNMLADDGQSSQGRTLLIAARVFLYRVLREADPRCLIPTIISERLMHQVRAQMETMASSHEYWHGLLWCLSLGASSTPGSSVVRDFFSTNVCEIVQMAGISGRAELEDIMESFLWDRSILGGALERNQSDAHYAPDQRLHDANPELSWK